MGVDVVAPEFERDDELLAVLRDRAGQRHGKTDLDRTGGASGRGKREPRQRNSHERGNNLPKLQHGRFPLYSSSLPLVGEGKTAEPTTSSSRRSAGYPTNSMPTGPWPRLW